MIEEVKAPTPGESISEVELSLWMVADGDFIQKNQEIAEIESDKATLAVTAPVSGKIKILVNEGDLVKVNSVICNIDTSVAVEENKVQAQIDFKAEEFEVDGVETKLAGTEEVVVKDDVFENADESFKKDQEFEKNEKAGKSPSIKITPLARERMKAENLDLQDVIDGLRRITASDIDSIVALEGEENRDQQVLKNRTVKRQRISQLRRQISKRLVQVKNETAMLTTFNEVDMSELLDLRKKYQDAFVDKFGFKIGLISFFMKASAYALEKYPIVNSMIEDDEIITPDYVDISVAIQSPKGLMVPVVRNVDKLALHEIESNLKLLTEKVRNGRISLEEMTGGTFTLTNGGVFGSMLSTPLINPPQSAIIGMHNIVERPVALKGKIEIKPVMYLALSYDHRIIDGKDSVSFLMYVKNMIENPLLILSGGKSPGEMLLGL